MHSIKLDKGVNEESEKGCLFDAMRKHLYCVPYTFARRYVLSGKVSK